MRSSFWKFDWKIFASLIGVWGCIFFLNFEYSKDVQGYASWFHDAQVVTFTQRLALISWTKDSAYYLLQSVAVQFISFPVFLGCVIFLCLFSKLLATMQLFAKPTWFLVLPYLFVLGFLHEGTQIRIAIALSFTIWAGVLWAKDRFIPALLFCFLGSLFHLSASIFFVILGALFLARRLNLYVYIAVVFCVLIALFFPVGEVLTLLNSSELAQNRYAYYLSPGYLKSQNSSGLFYFYAPFIGAITVINFWLYKPTNPHLKSLKNISLASSIFAILILISMSFAVQIATRLADLLLLIPLLVLGATLSELYEKKRYAYWLPILCALTGYFLMRSFITFGPVLTKPIL